MHAVTPKDCNTSYGLTKCQKCGVPATEKAQQLRATTALSEDPSVITSTHVRLHKTAYKPSFWRADTLFWPLRALAVTGSD